MSARVLMIGLGTMGLPIGLRLRAAGFAVSGLDPRPAARQAWAAAGAPAVATDSLCNAVASLREAGAAGAPGSPLVCVTCVDGEDALLNLWQSPDGLAAALAPGLLVIDHTTTRVATARRLAADAAAAGASWLDAPLSGGAAGAAAGSLSAMLGGAAADVARAQPLLAAYCGTLTHLGPAGAGQAGKLANQLAIAGTNAGLLAAAGFAAAQGLDLARCFDAMAAGSAHSVQMAQHRHALAQAPLDSARFDWLRRDLALASADLADLADLAHATTPAADAALRAVRHHLSTLERAFDGTATPALL